MEKRWSFFEILFAVALRRISRLNRQIDKKEKIIAKLDTEFTPQVANECSFPGGIDELEQWSKKQIDLLDDLLLGHPVLWPDILSFIRISYLMNVDGYKQGKVSFPVACQAVLVDYIAAINLINSTLRQEAEKLIEERRHCGKTMICF